MHGRSPHAPVCVIGAGPAGLSCALWLHNLGLQAVVIDSAGAAGGMARLNFLANNWVLGQPGMTGPQLADGFLAHLRDCATDWQLGCQVRQIRRSQGGGFDVSLQTADSEPLSLQASAIVIASGTRYRAAEVLQGIPGFALLPDDRLRYGPHAFEGLAALAGQRVVIVGGGDNAVENAVLCANAGAQVTLLARAGIRAQAVLKARAADAGCALHDHVQLLRFDADGGLHISIGNGERVLHATRIHVLAGYAPNTGFLAQVLPAEMMSALRFDGGAYLCADASQRSGCDGLYAAGDVCNPAFPSVVSALSSGAHAAKTIEADLRRLAGGGQ